MKSIHMITQLTLSIKSELIAKAKVYANANGTSVSKLVEDYFETISPSVADTADLDIPWSSDFGWKRDVSHGQILQKNHR